MRNIIIIICAYVATLSQICENGSTAKQFGHTKEISLFRLSWTKYTRASIHEQYSS